MVKNRISVLIYILFRAENFRDPLQNLGAPGKVEPCCAANAVEIKKDLS